MALVALAAGCTMDRHVRVDLPPDVERPPRAAVLLFVDGLGRDAFDRALAADDLPNIRAMLLDRGVCVEHAVAAIPTITYANAVTFLTGQLPGHHGIIANRWFDPTVPLARDYCTIATYQQVDHDYTAPTIHHLLHGRGTISLQAAQRRGCDRTFDNAISSGVNWFFGNFTGVDCMVAQNFGEIGDYARRAGRWPTLIVAYFPAVDHVGHDYGTASRQYRAAIRNLDRQIGRIGDALRQAGMFDRTYLALVSDHGLDDLQPDCLLDIPGVLRKNSGRRVAMCKTLADNPRTIQRVDAVCAYSGSRWMAVTFRDGDWSRRPVATGDDAGPFAGWLTGSGGDLLSHPAIGLAAGRLGPDAVWVRTPHGRAAVRRERRAGVKFYRYDPSPADALGYLDDPRLRSFIEAGAHDSRAWLAATARSPFPDLVPQIVEMFDSPRAGDIVFFAADGWDFSRDEPAAAHGGVSPRELLVPMIFAGPAILPGQTVPFARNCDVMPTLLDLLHLPDDLARGTNGDAVEALADIDGVSLLPQIRLRREVAAR